MNTDEPTIQTDSDPKWPHTGGQEISPGLVVRCMESMKAWALKRGLTVK